MLVRPTAKRLFCLKAKNGLVLTCEDENVLYCSDRVIFWYPYSSTSMECGLRAMVLAAAVTTHAKPHAQQQLARDLEVERVAMGQRCRPQSFGEV